MLAASVSINQAAMTPQKTDVVPQTPTVVIVKEEPSKPKTVKEQVEEYFADVPMLIRVAECESRFRQFDENGNVFRGVVPSDVGVMQINEMYWGKTASKLGIDLYTTKGNMQYARYLYEKEGLDPWSSSEHCWAQGTQLAVNK